MIVFFKRGSSPPQQNNNSKCERSNFPLPENFLFLVVLILCSVSVEYPEATLLEIATGILYTVIRAICIKKLLS